MIVVIQTKSATKSFLQDLRQADERKIGENHFPEDFLRRAIEKSENIIISEEQN